MGILAPVDNNGNLIPTGTDTTKQVKNGSTMDKDSFLQLLVAQMKYQDPLEPTSNTEYISQYATFSELEQMQQVNSNISIQRASALIGETVYMRTVNSITGAIGGIAGKVDSVEIQNGKAFLNILGNLYPIDDLVSVVSKEYLEASGAAEAFVERVAKLPSVDEITLNNKTEIEALNKLYGEMNDYQKGFLAEDVVNALKDYTKKIKELEGKQEEYAKEEAQKFEERMKKLPALEAVTLNDKKEIEELNGILGKMNDFEKGFLAKETIESLAKYVEKIKELET